MKVGATKDWFTVHEDLVCVSPFFRNLLQPRRKTVEGDCVVCHDPLDPDIKELTYCSTSCGNNFHLSCIEQWQAGQAGGFKCPLCRQDWKVAHPWGGVHTTLPNIHSEGFEVYTKWLYTSSIPTDLDFHALRRAYFLGETLDHQDFCGDVLSALVTKYVQFRTCPTINVVNDIYSETKKDSPIRKITVGMYAELSVADLDVQVLARWDFYNSFFQRDLVKALAKIRAIPPVDLNVEGQKARLLSTWLM